MSRVAAIALRPATPADAALLLAWRNDPETRRNSRRQHALSWAELIAAPVGAERATYVGESDGRPVGSVHIDRAAGPDGGLRYELSWTVAPGARGRGIGKALVAAALAEAERLGGWSGALAIVAMIKPENIASSRIATSLGFIAEGEQDGLVIWRRRGPEGR